MTKKDKLWMQKAFGGHKEGSLHRQLDVPMDKTIPQTLLTEIKDTPIGENVHNPTKIGKRKVKVTRLLKQRATLVHTANKSKR